MRPQTGSPKPKAAMATKKGEMPKLRRADRRQRAQSRQRRRSERGSGDEARGFALAEVALAMLVLLVVLGASTTLIMTALRVSSNSRFKQIATDVASGQLDSAIKAGGGALLGEIGFSGMAGVPQLSPNKVTEQGVTFTVEREVAPGNGACAAPSGGQPVELEVTVWATWAPNPTGTWWTANAYSADDVQESTLVAVPATALNPADGSVLVKVTDQTGTGQGLVDVAVSNGQSVMTTEHGCALFTNLPPGSYTATAWKAGWIDSNNDVNSSGTPVAPSWSGLVAAQQVTNLPPPGSADPYYAEAATIRAQYSVAPDNGLTPSPPENISALPLSLYNSNLASNPDVTAVPAQVFPWSGYTAVAGSCGSDSVPDGSIAADGVAVPANGSLSPGGSATASFTLTPLEVAVEDANGHVLQGANVTASASTPSGGTDPNCPSAGAMTAMPVLDLGPTCPLSDWQSGATCAVSTAYDRPSRRDRSDVLTASFAFHVKTRTALASSANPSVSGAPVTFTAVVTASFGQSAYGFVTFDVDSTVVACVGIGGYTKPGCSSTAGTTASYLTSSLAPGTYSISASFTGETETNTYGFPETFGSSSAAPVTEVVTGGTTTSSFATTTTTSGSGSTTTTAGAATTTTTAGSGTTTTTVASTTTTSPPPQAFALSGLPYGTFLIGATYTNSASGDDWSTANWSKKLVVKVTASGVSYTTDGGATWAPVSSGSPVVVVVK